MDQPAIGLRDAVGRRLNRDVFGANGVLLVSGDTILTRDHIETLHRHGIELGDRDTDPIGPYTESWSSPYGPMIDDAVLQAAELFDEIRTTRKVPIVELRNTVIPIVREAASGTKIFELFASLQAKDDYTFRHNIAVGAIAGLIGTWMKLDHQEQLQLTTAALLHDVGKLLLPEDILNKPGKLTEEEYAAMKRHTVLGYEILKGTVGVAHRQALVALQHHERMDGSGYPLGLTGDKIDLFSRIVSIADIFHAMTSRRVYRSPSPFYEVLLQMRQDTFGVLDPAITRLFIGKIMNGMIGHAVQLTDGSEGTIVMVHPHDPTSPLIRSNAGFVDLSQDLTVHIQHIL